MTNVKELRLTPKQAALLYYALKDINTVLETSPGTGLYHHKSIGDKWLLTVTCTYGLKTPINFVVSKSDLSFINFVLLVFIDRNDQAAGLFATKIGPDNSVDLFTLHISLNFQSMELSKKITNLYNEIL